MDEFQTPFSHFALDLGVRMCPNIEIGL